MKESRPLSPGKTGGAGSSLGDLGFEEAIPGESYVSDWESLKIEAAIVGKDADSAVLSLDGIIDTVSAESMRKALDKVISRGIYKIVIDMSQVEYVSSGGWGTFTERLREVRRAGGDIKLFGMGPDVYYVFTMLGFNIVLASFDILGEAIEDFGKEPSPKPSISVEPRSVRRPEPPSEPDIEPDDVADLLDGAPLLSARESSGAIEWKTPEPGVLVGYLSGAIEATVIETLTGETDSRLSQSDGVTLLIFDLSDVTYISSAGWGVFAKYHEILNPRGCAVALSGMNESLHEIYRCLEFQAFLRAYTSPGHAIGSAPRSGMQRPPASSFRKAKTNMTTGDHPGRKERPETEEQEQLQHDIASIDDLLIPWESSRTGIEHENDGMPAEVAGPEVFEEMPAAESSEEDETRSRASEESVAEDATRVTGEANEDELPAAVEERADEPSAAEGKMEDEDAWRTDDEGVTIDGSLHGDVQDDLIEEDWMAYDKTKSFVEEGTDLDLNKAISDEGAAGDNRLRKMGWGKYGDKLRKKAEKSKKKPEKDS